VEWTNLSSGRLATRAEAPLQRVPQLVRSGIESEVGRDARFGRKQKRGERESRTLEQYIHELASR
jgi:hypothetical protein